MLEVFIWIRVMLLKTLEHWLVPANLRLQWAPRSLVSHKDILPDLGFRGLVWYCEAWTTWIPTSIVSTWSLEPRLSANIWRHALIAFVLSRRETRSPFSSSTYYEGNSTLFQWKCTPHPYAVRTDCDWTSSSSLLCVVVDYLGVLFYL